MRMWGRHDSVDNTNYLILLSFKLLQIQCDMVTILNLRLPRPDPAVSITGFTSTRAINRAVHYYHFCFKWSIIFQRDLQNKGEAPYTDLFSYYFQFSSFLCTDPDCTKYFLPSV